MNSDFSGLVDRQNLPESESTSRLPRTLRLLCLGTTEPDWVALALQFDTAGCCEPQFRWTSTVVEALSSLRSENFDCLLVAGRTSVADRAGGIDPLTFLRGVRAAGCEDPVLVIVTSLRDGDWSDYCDLDCDILTTDCGWNSSALVPMIQRAIERRQMSIENRRLTLADHRRLTRERDEADHLLKQQRQILNDLQNLAGPIGEAAGTPRKPAPISNSPPAAPPTAHPKGRYQLPREVDNDYFELLRTYVMMGSGNLGSEIARIAEQFVAADVSPREALELHLERVELLARGLGNRSTRHVLARADLMALELMIHIAEHATRLRESESLRSPLRRVNGDVGIDLSGFR